MIRLRGLAYFLGYWSVVLVLTQVGGSGADRVLILAFFGFLFVGSLVAVSRGWMTRRGIGKHFYTAQIIPERWARWAMDEPKRPG